MNLILDTKPKISLKRKILYILVFSVCIGAILVGVYMQVLRQGTIIGQKEEYIKLSDEDYLKLQSNFENIFLNNINNNAKYNFSAINKIKTNDDIIAISYSNISVEDKKYSLNVNIPYININSTATKQYNNQIEKIFKQKALDILENTDAFNVIYTVEYTSYVNGDILSLIIRSTLKEGNNAQRVIIQTYNYNLNTNKAVTIDSLLTTKGITKNYAESEVRRLIKQKEKEVEELKELGYTIFDRDYTSNIYKIKNTTEFILGEQGRVYLIYAYGNDNFTSETDVIIL